MSRPKLKFTLSEDLRIKLDPKLKTQLLCYANRNDNGISSVSARRAIQRLLDEEKFEQQKELEKKKQIN